jgi:segregation and condensation protein B
MAFNFKKVLKALLFSSNQPLSVAQIQDVIVRFHEGATAPEAGTEGAAPAPEAAAGEPAGDTAAEAELYADVPALITNAEIRAAMDELAADLRAADDGYLLTEGAQGFRLVTHPRFARWVRALRNEPPPLKLSPTAMETLAVIAYRQPVTRAEIEHIRGVSAEAGLAKLLERELIYIVGRADLPGRPIQYGTTEAFLEFVGVRSLEELPATDVLSRQQINDWLQNAMRARHPSDGDMGLEEEAKEEQLSLADAARGAAAGPTAPEAGPAATDAPAPPPAPTPSDAP